MTEFTAVHCHPAAQLLIQSVVYGVDAGACLSGVNRWWGWTEAELYTSQPCTESCQGSCWL